jgi:hypothetical protein
MFYDNFCLFARAKRMRILQGLSDSSDDEPPTGTSGTPDDRAQTNGRMDSAGSPETADAVVASAEQNSESESAGCSLAGAGEGRTGCSGASCRLRADILRDLLRPSPSSDSEEET